MEVFKLRAADIYRVLDIEVVPSAHRRLEDYLPPEPDAATVDPAALAELASRLARGRRPRHAGRHDGASAGRPVRLRALDAPPARRGRHAASSRSPATATTRGRGLRGGGRRGPHRHGRRARHAAAHREPPADGPLLAHGPPIVRGLGRARSRARDPGARPAGRAEPARRPGPGARPARRRAGGREHRAGGVHRRRRGRAHRGGVAGRQRGGGRARPRPRRRRGRRTVATPAPAERIGRRRPLGCGSSRWTAARSSTATTSSRASPAASSGRCSATTPARAGSSSATGRCASTRRSTCRRSATTSRAGSSCSSAASTSARRRSASRRRAAAASGWSVEGPVAARGGMTARCHTPSVGSARWRRCGPPRSGSRSRPGRVPTLRAPATTEAERVAQHGGGGRPVLQAAQVGVGPHRRRPHRHPHAAVDDQGAGARVRRVARRQARAPAHGQGRRPPGPGPRAGPPLRPAGAEDDPLREQPGAAAGARARRPPATSASATASPASPAGCSTR